MKNNIAIIGFMGTGKSTVSRALHEALNMQEIDMDAIIAAEQGMPISKMFEKYGEEHFRKIETQLLQRLSSSENSIISCGGGTVTRAENVRILKSYARIILLTATPETVYARVKNSTARPVLNGNMTVEYIQSLMQKRAEAYRQATDITVSTDGKTVNQICEEIKTALK